MRKLNIDPAKLPLGALSQRQLDKGEKALEELEAAIEAGQSRSVLGRLTGIFYALIPHSFGRSAGPVIDSIDAIKAK